MAGRNRGRSRCINFAGGFLLRLLLWTWFIALTPAPLRLTMTDHTRNRVIVSPIRAYKDIPYRLMSEHVVGPPVSRSDTGYHGR